MAKRPAALAPRLGLHERGGCTFPWPCRTFLSYTNCAGCPSIRRSSAEPVEGCRHFVGTQLGGHGAPVQCFEEAGLYVSESKPASWKICTQRFSQLLPADAEMLLQNTAENMQSSSRVTLGIATEQVGLHSEAPALRSAHVLIYREVVASCSCLSCDDGHSWQSSSSSAGLFIG